jgi:putative oxidoreductase
MKKETILRGIAGIIAIMFLYAAVIKLSDYETSRQEMLNQVFPSSIASILTWAVPLIELTIIFFLVLTQTRLKGLYFALSLLTVYSVYIVVTMAGSFGRVPCSCANIISQQTTYGEQLIFNICFIVLILTGLTIEIGWLRNVQSLLHRKRKELAQS